MNNNTITQQGDSLKQFRVQRTLPTRTDKEGRSVWRRDKEKEAAAAWTGINKNQKERHAEGLNTLAGCGFNYLR